MAEDKSRFAELVGELMGAQAAKEILDRIWNAASPEVKQKLADSVLVKVMTDLGEKDKYSASNVAISKFVGEQTEAALKAMELPSMFASVVKEKVDAQWPGYVQSAVMDTIRKLTTEFAERLKPRY